MPLAGADPAFAVVRVNGEEIKSVSAPLSRLQEFELDLGRFGGGKIELELAARAGPRGERAAWVEWRNPRIVTAPQR